MLSMFTSTTGIVFQSPDRAIEGESYSGGEILMGNPVHHQLTTRYGKVYMNIKQNPLMVVTVWGLDPHPAPEDSIIKK
jgi:hypothetical protein